MIRSVLPVASVVAALACSAQQPSPATPGALPQSPPQKALAAPQDESTSIRISDELRQLCGLPQDETYFDYDSDEVQTNDEGVLTRLADCFQDGPMAGKDLRLVGHADPRGEDSYNLALGERRAASVRRVLIELGLSGDRITTTSRGEMDATGSNEATWAKDRRVDIMSG